MSKKIHQSNRKTDRIIESNKRERIIEIYEMLTLADNKDGVISAQNIDLHSLPTDILEAFSLWDGGTWHDSYSRRVHRRFISSL